MIEARFTLLDHDGRSVSERDFRGRWMLVYFGFTNCQIVCPRSLAKLSAALEAIGADADRVVPLYITVDPERDTPEVMKAWLAQHYPRFTGLTGATSDIADAKAAFRVFAQAKADDEAPGGYVVPHTAISYLIDPEGRYRAHFLDSNDSGSIAEKLKTILCGEGTTSDA